MKSSKIFLLSYVFVSPVFANDNPCSHSDNLLLALINRPTASDSACVVPTSKVVLESGYQYQSFYYGGYSENYPEAQLRFGLPLKTEFVWTLPNYYHQNVEPHSGFGAMVTGLKHQFITQKNWVLTGEVLITLPTGSADFGSQGVGYAINAISSYNISELVNLTLMMGFTSQTLPKNSNGGRYNSFNPDVVVSFNLSKELVFYAEVYGYTKIGPNEGAITNADSGFIYLVNPHVAVDIEAGVHLGGSHVSFKHYYGLGLSLLS